MQGAKAGRYRPARNGWHPSSITIRPPTIGRLPRCEWRVSHPASATRSGQRSTSHGDLDITPKRHRDERRALQVACHMPGRLESRSQVSRHVFTRDTQVVFVRMLMHSSKSLKQAFQHPLPPLPPLMLTSRICSNPLGVRIAGTPLFPNSGCSPRFDLCARPQLD
jgi:hypothetical protein